MDALAQVKTMKGLLPICSSCKKIRSDENYWQSIETYIQQHSEASFTHGICPDCVQKLYGYQPKIEGKR
jgi:mannose-1-phosphate guanylyltransferase